jgi:Lar family restriction alleviation protein
MVYLAPCPFCGAKPYFERVGTNRVSCIIACSECGCRLETNEAGDMVGKQWNYRPIGHNGSFIDVSESQND